MRALFRSKVDGRFKWIALAMPCVALLALLTGPRGGGRLMWIPAGIVALVAVIVCWIFLATYYELEGDRLLTRCGPFTWSIPLADVTDVRESSSVRSGPALSLDRLQVTCRDGRALLISPADKAGFMAALRRRAPHLQG
ncbi:MAG TPA: PH domain-containing protein [Steroidobacteraceae bacterium]|nr:PH domain-containing protein [Steroidobacteraceae bacterium]